MFKKIMILTTLIIMTMTVLVSASGNTALFDDKVGERWSFSQNTTYVLQQYDSVASHQGCGEWLATFKGQHTNIEVGYFIVAAEQANWAIELNYHKPVVGAIAYWDNKGSDNFAFAFEYVKDIKDDMITLSFINSNGVVQEKTVPIEQMSYIHDKRFRGYIYPWKVGESPKN